jgi:rhodanese-related sulfurtransferase/protein-L-isoaspartate O-methyltransferase
VSVETIPAAAAETLVAEGKVRVLDVRNPNEWAGLGTIPGATLLPVDLVACAAATLPRDGAPILVCCEHGIRSAAAARFLDAAGFEGVLDLAGGMSTWTGPRQFDRRDPDPVAGPSSWLLQCADLLRPPAVLDVACGRGRHALLLASAGFNVRAIDSDPAAIAGLGATADRLGLPVRAEVADLETHGADLGEGLHDVVLVVHYLHRPLFPALRRALRPGGILIYETFTEAQAARGRPTSPDHLLQSGELERLVAPLQVVRRREGEFEDRFVASVAARRVD